MASGLAASEYSSSDLDTQSTGSFFHDRSITLGSLIGVSNILEFSRKPSRVRKVEGLKESKSNKKHKTWLFSLCSRNTTDAQSVNNPPSLAHFLAVERRAANEYRRNQSPNNSLFVNGEIAPPRVRPWHETDAERRRNGGLGHSSGHGVPVLFSCMCGESC
ncbi:uncharacterized protein At3g17950 isoform X2 [Manihot esculenta]|uniref:Uncharacterized protein n=2 Tax=Manihot esculenta TaxID=3983 RepID=A0ACB7GXX0_MANES|nr:uncharacterized protein At3g17950 isoform X2 [Manihot esculenta]XP_021628880.1 uncharacterized protein At3g17950 isoform X2 [Manihot esculenta]XP_043817594.1 uncharacterized protein At3g17950 isoform X2 [Manihot esculenta]KAG8644468.1 hypothetical protein MANES_11G131300v8 [Manihot esculenta]KAG8644469.1 hypothetical protein MANES_11G131300v8 [Manihot esculenta]